MAAVGSRRQAFRRELEPLVCHCLHAGDEGPLRAYLMQHSGLPGPRGNLELAAAFVQEATQAAHHELDRTWSLSLSWTGIHHSLAPTGDPLELLPFCGAWALGSIAAVTGQRVEEARERLKALSRDQRWRLREAVANGLQALLTARPQETLEALSSWIGSGAWLEMRAVAAGVADPVVLARPWVAAEAVALHQRLLDQVETAEDRTGDFRVFRQALGYTISVVAVAHPESGPALLARLARSQDRDLAWILRENLRKRRLVRAYPDLVRRLREGGP
ncbi:MAG: hypothetical protein HPY83_12515 [Anaerolineae bacterium]|nr:hypothetical protein [Anaerolineae bacterium]